MSGGPMPGGLSRRSFLSRSTLTTAGAVMADAAVLMTGHPAAADDSGAAAVALGAAAPVPRRAQGGRAVVTHPLTQE